MAISEDVNDNVVQVGSETWNIADAFVKIKIFKPMYECDRYEMIALYGTENIGDPIPYEEKVMNRIEALSRYKDSLRIIFENSNFIIHKEDRDTFTNLRKHLLFIEEIMDGVSQIEEDYVKHTKQVVINEEHFRKCLRALQKIKEEIHTPLNNAGIIFRQTDEMSFKELLDDIAEGG